MILYHELKTLDFMNSLVLWMKWTTMGRLLRALDDIDNSGLWIT